MAKTKAKKKETSVEHELLEAVGRCVTDLNETLAKLRGKGIAVHIAPVREGDEIVPRVNWSFNRPGNTGG